MAVSPASPYNFVRLAEHVWVPDGKVSEPDGKVSPASHDVPFKDGVCGTLEVELRCHAPLMVGGQRESNAVGFFRTPGGQRAVPGSSLRGMLRNVLEIAAFGRMGMVDDRRIRTRDRAFQTRDRAFPLSVHDTIRKTAAAHLEPAGPDLPELLFGSAAQADGGMRGRVTCGLAIEEIETRGPRGVKLILNSPKPSYYPFYVRQDMEPNGQVYGGWRGYAPPARGAAGPEIRGWKRYPARSDAWQRPPEQNRVATTLCDPASEGAVFRFQIRLHNLRPFELGALAWALGFGEDPSGKHESRAFRHGLGMAKPYGFGLVTLRVTGGRLIHNRLAEDGQEVVEGAAAALHRLRSAMDAFAKRITAWTEQCAKLPWENTPQYRQLRAMALPRDAAKQPALRYMTLKDFADLKKDGRRTLPDPALPDPD